MSRPQERPIFVIGVARSGTTLLRFMLCSHPRIYIPPQSHFIPRLFGRRPHAPLSREQAVGALRTMLRSHPFGNAWKDSNFDPAAFVGRLPDLLPATLLDALYRQYARQYDAERWGDKTPTYTAQVGLLADLFPEAQFIHIIRDGRDVALSEIDVFRRFDMDIFFAARTWRQGLREVFAARAGLGPERYHETRYERLVAEPEPVLQEICQFLGERYVPAMAEPYKVAREQVSSTGVHGSTWHPVTTRSAGRWRREMSLADQRLFQTVAGDLLAELGYPTVELGLMPPAERARLARLHAKYVLVDAGRRAVQAGAALLPRWRLPQRFRALPHARAFKPRI